MLAEQRREKILNLIRENGSARVSKLSRIFDVSEPTIRQDLTKIEKAGEIIRDHGGAYLKNISNNVRSLSLEHQENMPLKIKIGEKAAEFVQPGSTIILDSGSTISELAKHLVGYPELRVITNSINIALLLGAVPSIKVHMTGGEFKAPTISLTGDKAADYFSDMHADQLFMAAAGISITDGLTFPGFSDIPVKKAMMKSSKEVYLLVDSTKINHSSFAILGALDAIDFLITDNGIKEEDKLSFEKQNIKVIIAE